MKHRKLAIQENKETFNIKIYESFYSFYFVIYNSVIVLVFQKNLFYFKPQQGK